MRIFLRVSLILIINLLIVSQSPGQGTNHEVRIGFGFLIGKQNIFPFNDLNYSHSQKGYRLQFNYTLRSGKFSYELQIEPSVYIAEHQLLNPYFIQPSDGSDYLFQREYYMQKRTITDYALNIGFVTRYNFNDKLSTYFLFSTGPTWLDSATERQAKGFAFSNVLSIGVAYNTNRFRFEFGPGVRHVSNASTHFPNGGHNSSTLDFGITYLLGKIKVTKKHDPGLKQDPY
jgi:hypothetical protein